MINNTISKSLVNYISYLGCNKNSWKTESSQFILGFKHNITIFNIPITVFYLSRACRFVEITIKAGGRSFFFGFIYNNYDGKYIISKLRKIDQVVSTKNWQGGYITNTRYFKHSIFNFTKKFNMVISGRFDYSSFPSLFESNRISLPLIAPVDSNVSPIFFNYPIPCNSSGSGVYILIKSYFVPSVFKGLLARPARLVSGKSKKFYDKQTKYGRRWNRTTALSFSGLNSTIELSPF